MLREHYLTADMGISGGNFFVAETGSVVLVTNEGNATLTTTLPKVHVAISGIEKIVPTLEDVATLMRLLPRSSTGQSISNYVDVLTGAEGRGRVPRRRAHVLHRRRQRPHRRAGERRARGAALHPLRRLHESLPGLPERRRPLVRLGVSRADRLDPDADVRRPREGAGPAGGVDAVQPVRRRLPGARFRCPTCSASCARRRSRRGLRPWYERAALAAVVVGRAASRALRAGERSIGVRMLQVDGRPRRHDPQAAARRRLDRRPRHAGAGGHARFASSIARSNGRLPHERPAQHRMFPCRRSRAAPNRSAPRTRSSCWRRSTRWCAQGKDIVSFCIGQPDFPTPANVQDAAIAAIRARQARLHAVGRHRRAARGRGEGHRRAARHRSSARGRRRRRGRQAVHRVRDRVGHRLRRRRRGDLSGARVPDLRIADRRQRRGAGADLPARVARLRVRSRRARGEDHAEDEAPDPQHAAQPDRRDAAGGRPRRDRRDPAPASAGLGVRRRDLLAPRLRGRVRHARAAGRGCRSARSSATARRRPGR